jgi:tetratricopeptide (TPR) repeat protein
MRTNLIRGVLSLAVVLAMSAPALAQSVVRGKVVDGQGKPVPDATVLFEAEGVNRRTQLKTDRNGDFLQVGLQSGSYKVTVTKEGVGSATQQTRVSQGQNQPLSFTISPQSAAAAAAASLSPEEKEKAAKLQAAAGAAVAALNSKQYDEAINQFNQVVALSPTCLECYLNLGTAYGAKQQYAEAEAAYKKALELKPDSADAYTGLTNIYNAQKKFDLAADASAKAAQYSGGGAGGGAEATYNQGVIFFNAGKFAEAKTQFEAATKADPNMAMAHYQLGMTALNLGDIPTAVSALETYLKVDPNGARAAEVKASLPALQGMLKK